MQLNLDGNLLRNLTRRSFGRLPVVAELTLSGNRLDNVTVGAFEGLLQLQRLDLSRNNLTYVPPGAFKSESGRIASTVDFGLAGRLGSQEKIPLIQKFH